MKQFSILLLAMLVVGKSSEAGWEDIKKGDCLTEKKAPELVPARDPMIFIAGKCDTDYALAGDAYQQLSCGLEAYAGSWERTILQHSQPGFYFPKPVPCMKSVDWLLHQWVGYEDIEDTNLCSSDRLSEIFVQEEELITEKFFIGQGSAYLPQPLRIKRQGIRYAESYSEDFCDLLEVRIAYKGWGGFEAVVEEYDCISDKLSLCREYQVKASKTDEGQHCALVERVKDCSRSFWD